MKTHVKLQNGKSIVYHKKLSPHDLAKLENKTGRGMKAWVIEGIFKTYPVWG
jgi:hypothetical protein